MINSKSIVHTGWSGCNEITTERPDLFLLEEKALFEITSKPDTPNHPRWLFPTHLQDARYSLVLIAGERIITKCFKILHDSQLFFRISTAIPEISPDGLTCSLYFFDLSKKRKIGEFTIPGGGILKEWMVIELNLAWLAESFGRLIVECGPGPQNDPAADWLAISDLCVARENEIKAHLARTHHYLRIENEIAHFSATYREEMYSDIQNRQSEIAKGCERKIRIFEGGVDHVIDEYEVDFEDVLPDEGESTYAYAARLMRMKITTPLPDYVNRLREKVRACGNIKVLSICSGAARIEAELAAAVPHGVEWALLDINEDLLQLAARQFSPSIKLDLIKADANHLSPNREKWDVILCVSALHHLVELENVMSYIANSLNEDGEFWSIGEAVGRNGNRLWPEAKKVADVLFSGLAENYRLNAYTKKIDSILPDNDFSITSFEGIRSEEILSHLDRWFKPIEVYCINCFLWRTINLAYSKNFNICQINDRKLIAEMVRAEMQYYRKGGRGTELFGVYKRRDL